MEATLNISECADNDLYYRYKMPKLITKIEGKGNGIKTIVVNLSDVAKALSRPPSYPIKYFGYELGAQTRTTKEDRFIINGVHEASKLQDLLSRFIKQFVMCVNCLNPETRLRPHQHYLQSKKNRKYILQQHCIACGFESTVDDHKLNTFVLNDIITTNTMEKKKRCVAVEEEKNLPLKQRIDLFHTFVSDERRRKTVDAKKIYDEAVRLDVKNKAPLILVEVLLLVEEDDDLFKQLKQYRNLFLRFCFDNDKAQKYLLKGIENMIWFYYEGIEWLLIKVPNILKTLYDLDIVDEEVFMEWHADTKTNATKISDKIRQRAKPFITWLEEAETDDE